MGSLFETISVENPVFKAYAFWSAVLVLKILAMSILTGMQRVKNKVSFVSIDYGIKGHF
jgi:glutathione S-transferase